MTRIAALSILTCWAFSSGGQTHADWPKAIGVIGDSYSDEYQFYGPDRKTARNWVEILSSTRHLSFGLFSASSRGGSRQQGFEFNWASSGATTDDVIAHGQHFGLAEQVKNGDVDLVVVFIGGNDFIDAIGHARKDSVKEREEKASKNLETVIETVKQAHSEVKLVIATVPDITQLPDLCQQVRAGKLDHEHVNATRVALQRFNNRIRLMSLTDRRIGVLDLHLGSSLAGLLGAQPQINVAGHPVRMDKSTNEPSSLFLADGRHMGSVGQGLIAMQLIQTINVRFGAHVEPLSGQEIWQNAERFTPLCLGQRTTTDPIIKP